MTDENTVVPEETTTPEVAPVDAPVEEKKVEGEAA